MGKERRGRRRGKEDEGGKKESLPPLEWRSGYAPDPLRNLFSSSFPPPSPPAAKWPPETSLGAPEL